MIATVPHVTSGLGLGKFLADGFLTRVYSEKEKMSVHFMLPIRSIPHPTLRSNLGPEGYLIDLVYKLLLLTFEGRVSVHYLL